MLTAIKDLGEIIIKRDSKEALDIFVEAPENSAKFTDVITIDIDVTQDKFKFIEVALEDFDSLKKMQYLYRRGAPTSIDFSPTARVSNNPAGTFERKILRWFQTFENRKSITDADNRFLQNIYQVLRENEEVIKEQILDFRQSVPRSQALLLTLLRLNLIE